MHTPQTYLTTPSQFSPSSTKKKVTINELPYRDKTPQKELILYSSGVDTIDKGDQYHLNERITRLEANVKRINQSDSPVTLKREEKVYELNHRVTRLEEKIHLMEYENSRRFSSIEDQLKRLTLMISRQNNNIDYIVYEQQPPLISHSINNLVKEDKKYNDSMENEERNGNYNSQIKSINTSGIDDKYTGYESTPNHHHVRRESQASPDFEKRKIHEKMENLRSILKDDKDKYKSNIAKLQDADITTKQSSTFIENTPKVFSRKMSNLDQNNYNTQTNEKAHNNLNDTNTDLSMMAKTDFDTLTLSNGYSSLNKYTPNRRDYTPGGREYNTEKQTAIDDEIESKYGRIINESVRDLKDEILQTGSIRKSNVRDYKSRRSQDMNNIAKEENKNQLYKQQMLEEKKRQIDQEIERRIQEEAEKKKKLNASVYFLNKMSEKIDNNQPTYIRNPYSTEKSREKEVSARLQIEKKMRADLINKFEKAASRSISRSKSPL